MFDKDIKRVIIGVADDIEQDKNAWTPSWRPGYDEASINISLLVNYIARTTGTSLDSRSYGEFYDSCLVSLLEELRKRKLYNRVEGDILYIFRKVK
jgi:hypothetical protein